jgi:putative transposase
VIFEFMPGSRVQDMERAPEPRLSGSRATIYRRRRRRAPRPPAARAGAGEQLSEAERQRILAALRSPEYCDLAPAQVWARLLDDGIYL